MGLASALESRVMADPLRGPSRDALGPEKAPGPPGKGRARSSHAGGPDLMFFDVNIVGDRLPPGTLCLTYDDGPGRSEGGEDDPGPRTPELGAFLRSEGVPATF